MHLVNEGGVAARLEWVHTTEHLVEDEAQTVPVNRVSIALVLDDLGSEILSCPAETLGHPVGFVEARLGEPEVGQADVTL